MRGDTLRSFEDFCELLRELNFTPTFVVDVGCASGTAGILNFEGSYVVLIEPLEMFEGSLRQLLETRQGEFHLCAAGAHNENRQIRLGSSRWDASLLWDPRPHDPIVEVRRLDSILAPTKITSPALIKLDVQGSELDALRGLGDLLRLFELIIIETSMNPPAGPDFGDVVKFMGERAFSLFDVIGASYRPLDKALGQLDLVFCRTNSPLRRNKGWSNP